MNLLARILGHSVVRAPQEAPDQPIFKTLDQRFADWESWAIGYGYGSGEEHTLAALKRFLDLVPAQGSYKYEQLEAELTPAVAWLMISILCRTDILCYGSSPRFGFLTEKGRRLKAYVEVMSVEKLIEVIEAAWEPDYAHCNPDMCNCGVRYIASQRCPNPFWS